MGRWEEGIYRIIPEWIVGDLNGDFCQLSP